MLGVLGDTKNLTFDNQGKLRLSKKSFALYTNSDDSDLAYPLSIVYYDNGYIVLTSDELFEFDLSNKTLTEIASSPTTDLNSDMVVFNNYVYITVDNNLSKWNGSWTDTLESLTTSVPHPLAVFESRVQLAIGNDNTVLLVNTSDTLVTTLTLPTEYQVTTMRYRNGYMYIGTKNKNGGEAKLFIWNGATTGFQYECPTGASWVFSLTPYGNTVAGITNDGKLFLVNGTALQTLSAFPIFYDSDATWIDSNGLAYNGKVFNRGMATIGDTIYINVDATLASGYSPEMKSGLWVFDPAVGLYHRAFHSTERLVQDASLSVTNSVITTSAAHGLKDGDCVCFSLTSGLSGVDTRVKYYVKVMSTTTIKLALSLKSLLNEHYVTISGTAGSSDRLVYIPNNDIGMVYDSTSGAIAPLSPLESALPNIETPVIWGALTENAAGTARYVLNALCPSFHVGSFTTQRIYTANIDQVWQKLYLFLDGVLSANEKCVLKYKTGNALSYPTRVMKGTWATTTTIHSDPTTYDEDMWHDIEVSNELTITDGYGRGYTCHVTNIDTSSNTFVLTVDEAIGTVGGTTYFYADNFVKISTVDNTRRTPDYIKDVLKNAKSPWVQLKVELRGFETEIAYIDLTSGAHSLSV